MKKANNNKLHSSKNHVFSSSLLPSSSLISTFATVSESINISESIYGQDFHCDHDETDSIHEERSKCSCHEENQQVQRENTESKNTRDKRNHTCQNYFKENNLSLPPPLPEPIYSFHRRVLPTSLIQLSSPDGKRLFQQSLIAQTAESFFPLSEQFLNQSDPAYCGITSLIMVLNAFGIDPNVRWKGGWRWYGSEDMILDSCCVDSERVKRAGISMEEFTSLGRCQGLEIETKRPIPLDCDSVINSNDSEQFYNVESFRKDIMQMVQNPPPFESNEKIEFNDEKNDCGFIVVSFARTSLGQTGDGHFSPIAAYHEASDRCLILDVARFKYGPYWVKVPDLYEATRPLDSITNKSRGWLMNYPPKSNSLNGQSNEGKVTKGYKYAGSKTIDEVKRPAEVVPVVQRGTNIDVCPVNKIKIKYCTVAKK